MSLVYIVNKAAHDYSDAERFGDLVFCTDGALNRYDTSQMYRELYSSMKDSMEEDYILLTSLTSLCSIACAIFAHKHGCLNLLIHRDVGYVERKLVFQSNTRSTNDTSDSYNR